MLVLFQILRSERKKKKTISNITKKASPDDFLKIIIGYESLGDVNRDYIESLRKWLSAFPLNDFGFSNLNAVTAAAESGDEKAQKILKYFVITKKGIDLIDAAITSVSTQIKAIDQEANENLNNII